MSKKLLITIVFIFFTSLASAQLHHQMLSSQGSTVRTDNGIIATQTIGQQSVIGNYSTGEINGKVYVIARYCPRFNYLGEHPY